MLDNRSSWIKFKVNASQIVVQRLLDEASLTIERNPNFKKTSRQACAIESGAQHNPFSNIFVLTCWNENKDWTFIRDNSQKIPQCSLSEYKSVASDIHSTRRYLNGLKRMHFLNRSIWENIFPIFFVQIWRILLGSLLKSFFCFCVRILFYWIFCFFGVECFEDNPPEP